MAPITIWIVGAYIDIEPVAVAGLGLIVPAGAALVLVSRTLVAWIAPGAAHQPVWADWAWLVGSPCAGILTLILTQIHARRDNARSDPIGRCRRCAADLYADHATHNHPNVKKWLARNPRITMHFTRTGAYWMNMVEIFFGIITRQAIRRGTFVPDLIGAIRTFIDAYNQRCEPFTWTKTADQILTKASRMTASRPTGHG